ncbi:hypothetical protein HK100_006372 [Physocladia obscura]|uniref:Cytochrome b561 domain-containing protein n=1 Tax=Physocladia obscura TaxID=109957 RepID=A0AAD5T6A1_9FUNG|nr:hypothetical protein HK100_006372 [Physocladia obscura]
MVEFKTSEEVDTAVELNTNGNTNVETRRREGKESKAINWVNWGLARVFTVVFIVILFLWIYEAEGGLGLQEGDLFGLHALGMTIFVLVCTQEALLTLSPVPVFGAFAARRVRILVHIALHSIGIVFAMLGLVAIVYYKNLSGYPLVFPYFHVYSPHSWVGIVVLSLWIIQAVSKLAGAPRKYHAFLGNAIYITGLAACALGLQDMQSSDLASSTSPADAMNMAGMNMSGYLPNSDLAQYAASGSIVLIFQGIATYFVQL